MTTQYTSILKLALPVQGELSGTWGDVVNDNITSMVEEAVAGRAVINTWTTNSHVLTTADGTTAESRCAMLEFTDTGAALTGAATVVCPSLSKLYVCKNDSGQQVTIKTAAGTGVAIPDGQTMFVFCDGTNVEQCTTNFNSLSFNDYTLSFGGAVTTAGAFTTSGAYALTLTTTGATNVTLPTTGTLATLDGTETLTNKTLTTPTISSPTLTGSISATDLTISGNTTIGDAATDTLTVTSTITSNLIFTDDTYDIGASGATRPRNLFLSGNATIGGTVTLSGGIDVTGALGVDGNFDVNTDKFTVASATGNTAVAGTLGVTGATTATGGLNVDTINEITAAGGVTIDSVLLKDGGATLTDDLVVDTDTLFVDASLDRVVFGDTAGSYDVNVRKTTAGGDVGFMVENRDTTQTLGTRALFAMRADVDDDGTLEEFLHIRGGTNTSGFAEFVAREGASMRFQGDAATSFVFNDSGVDQDFRVESDTNTHMLFVDAGNDSVSVGTASNVGTLTVDGSVSTLGTYDNGALYGQLEVPSVSITTNSARYLLICRTSSSGRFVNGTFFGARTIGSSATRTQSYTVTAAVNSSGVVQHANLSNQGLSPGDTVKLVNCTYDGITWLAIEISGAATSVYPAGYYFQGLASSTDDLAAVDTSLVSSVSDYTDVTGSFSIKNQNFSVENGEVNLSDPVRIESTNAGAGVGPTLELYRNSASPVDGDLLGEVKFLGEDDAGNSTTYASIFSKIADASNGTEDGVLYLQPKRAATLIEGLTLSQAEAVFNNESYDVDFRVESNTNTHALFVDASTDRVGINEDTPTNAKLHVDAGASGDNAARFETAAAGGVEFVRVTNVGNGSTHFGLTWKNSDTDIFSITTRNRSGATASSGDIAYELQNIATNASSYYTWYIGGAEYLELTATGTVFNSDNGTNKLYVTRNGATNQSGSLYADDNTFVFDSTQDETSGANFLFRGTNATTTNFNYLDLSYSSGASFNDGGRSNFDFRVESGSNTHMLFVDAGSSEVGIGISDPTKTLDVGGEVLVRKAALIASPLTKTYTGATDSWNDGGALRHTIQHFYAAAPAAEQWRKIAELPASSGVTGEKLQIRVFLSALQQDDYYQYDLVMGQRNAFDAKLYNAEGTSSALYANAGIKCYTQTDGTTDVYMYCDSGGALYTGFTAECWADGFAQTAELISPADVTTTNTTPAGTLVFDTTSDTYHKTRFYLGEDRVVVNENSFDLDFRVESVNDPNALFVNAGTDRVAVGASNPSGKFEIFGSNAGDIMMRIVNSAYSSADTSGDNKLQFGWQNHVGASIVAYKDGTINRTGFKINTEVGFNTETERLNLGSNGSFTLTPDGSGHAVFNEDAADADFRVESESNANMLFVDASANIVNIGDNTSNWTAPNLVVSAPMLDLSSSTARTTNAGIVLRPSSSVDNTGWYGMLFSNSTVDGYGYTIGGMRTTGSGDGAALDVRYHSNSTSGSSRMYIATDATVFNEDSADQDFRVESDNNSDMLFVDAGADRVSMGTSSHGDAQLTVQNENNAYNVQKRSSSTISGAGTRASMLEGVYCFNITSSGNQLSIPVFSQSSNWKPYYVELIFQTGEYNAPQGPVGGRVIFELRSLNSLSGLNVLLTEGNVSGMATSGMNLLVNFTTAYNQGLSNYEGVLCHARVFGTAPQYLEMDNATLN